MTFIYIKYIEYSRLGNRLCQKKYYVNSGMMDGHGQIARKNDYARFVSQHNYRRL